MSSSLVFVPAGLKVGSVYLGHCGDQNVDNKLDDLTIFPSGDWAPNFAGSKQWDPEFTVQTFDLAKALDLMTTNVSCRDCAAETLKLYQRAVARNAMQEAEASAVHGVFQLQSDAMLYWEQIQCNQADEAQITVKAAAYSNGANAILAQLKDESIDTASTVVPPYTLGPIVLNGSTLNQVKGLTWQQNPQVKKEASDGDPSPTLIYLDQIRPVVQFETTDLEALQVLGASGADVTSLTVWFRRRKAADINYADNQAYHAKLYNAGGGGLTIGTLKWRQVSNSPARARCEIHLVRRTTGVALFSWSKDIVIT